MKVTKLFLVMFFCNLALPSQASVILHETFESQGTCATIALTPCPLTNGFLNVTNDDQDWLVNSLATPSTGTGPSADFNLGTAHGRYLYLEASLPGFPGDTALLLSPVLDLTLYSSVQVTFAYHMFGATIGELHFDARSLGGSLFMDDIAPPIIGNQGDQWFQKTIDLSAFSGQSDFQFQVRGTTGTSFTGDIAIDDFLFESVTAAPEPSTLFLIGTGTVGLVSFARRKRPGKTRVFDARQRSTKPSA